MDLMLNCTNDGAPSIGVHRDRLIVPNTAVTLFGLTSLVAMCRH